MRPTLAAIAAIVTLLYQGNAAEPAAPITFSIESSPGNIVYLIVNSDPGEVVIEFSTRLDPNSWIEYGRLASISRDNTPLSEFPFDPRQEPQFFRAKLYPALDGFYINSDIATAIHEGIDFSLLDTAFNLGFPDSEAGIILADEAEPSLAAKAEQSPRNLRVYAATIATLVRSMQIIRSDSQLDSQPNLEELIATLSEDLQDGILDHPSIAHPVDTWQLARSLMGGLDDVEIKSEEDGTVSFTIPAIWDQSNWGSADWQ